MTDSGEEAVVPEAEHIEVVHRVEVLDGYLRRIVDALDSDIDETPVETLTGVANVLHEAGYL